MKVKVKRMIVCKFGVTLYPNKEYTAYREKKRGRYSVQWDEDKIVSVLVDERDIIELN